MGHQGIAINDMCEEDKIEGLHPHSVPIHTESFIFLYQNSFGNSSFRRKKMTSFLHRLILYFPKIIAPSLKPFYLSLSFLLHIHLRLNVLSNHS